MRWFEQHGHQHPSHGAPTGAVWTAVDVRVDEGYLKIPRGTETEEIMILPCGQPIIDNNNTKILLDG